VGSDRKWSSKKASHSTCPGSPSSAHGSHTAQTGRHARLRLPSGDAGDAIQRDRTPLLRRGVPADPNGDGRRDLLTMFQTQETGIDA
jgi:hypothetical protein